MEIILTKHAKKRRKQRFPDLTKDEIKDDILSISPQKLLYLGRYSYKVIGSKAHYIVAFNLKGNLIIKTILSDKEEWIKKRFSKTSRKKKLNKKKRNFRIGNKFNLDFVKNFEKGKETKVK